MNEKIRDLFRNYVGYLAVAFVSLAYIATAFVTFEGNAKSLPRIIADGVAAFILGILINRIFDAQGIVNGERDPRVLETSRLHGQIVDGIGAYLGALEDWCERKNAEVLCRMRRKFLSSRGMRYEEYFDGEGMAKPFEARPVRGVHARWLEFRRRVIFERAVHMKLTQLTAGSLTSDGVNPSDPFYMGRSKPEYLAQSTRKDVLTKLMLALVIGYYSAELIRNFNPAYLIWTVFQVGVFIAMGVMKMQRSTIYVTDEYRGRIIKKIDILQQFEAYLKKEELDNGKKQNAEITEGACGGGARQVFDGAEKDCGNGGAD